jgi:hypothetical protein
VHSVTSKELQALAQAGISPEDPSVAGVLERIAIEVKGRAQNASPQSAEFFGAVAESLKLFRGPANHKVRVECLLEIAPILLCPWTSLPGGRACVHWTVTRHGGER